MGIASRIFNILVLLAAITAVVFAYMLWEKREQITLVREAEAKAIAEVAKNLDPDSTITAKDLSIEKTPAQVKKPLGQLDEIGRKIVAQRNDIAKAYVALEEIVLGEDKLAKADDVIAYPTTNDNLRGVKDRTQARIDYHKNRMDIVADYLDQYIKIYDAEGALDKTSVDNFNVGNENLKTEFGKLKDKGVKMRDERNDLVANSREIAIALELEEPDYDSSVADANSKLINGVKTYAQHHKDLIEGKKQVDSELASAKDDITDKEGKIAELNSSIRKKDNDIASLKQRIRDIIGGSGGLFDNEQARFDFSLLRQVQGKIVRVEPELGFIVIGFGKNNKVVKDVDGKKETVDIAIPREAIMTVATSLDPDTASYVVKAQAFKVEQDMTFANIIPSGSDSALPKSGDIVFFSQPDIKAMIANDQKTRTANNVEPAVVVDAAAAAPQNPASVDSAAPAETSDDDEIDLSE